MAKKMQKKEKDLHNPKEFYNLYENELESDVTLLVGQEGWQERVPAHSWVLASGSDYFRTLLQGPFANSSSRIHHFPDDPKGFNNFIRWLYQNKCDLQSLQSSLDTLSVSIKYLCPDLAERCIIQLTNQLSVDNVLKVLQWIYCYCSTYEPPMPSAPTLEEMEESEYQRDLAMAGNSSSSSSLDPTVSCHILLNECLDLIDKHSDEVLSSEHLLTVDAPVLQMVLIRDSLKLRSELKVVKALHKWSTATCKRQHLPLTLENRRKVLGSLLYLARLLTLSVSEVEKLYSKENESFRLLTDDELIFIDAHVKKLPLPPVPDTMKDHISVMSNCRGQKENTNVSKALVMNSKGKRKSGLKKRFNFNKKEIILDLVSVLGLIFD